MPRRPRPLHSYVRNSLPPEMIRSLANQALWLRRVQDALPDALASQCRYCMYKDGQLIIQVNSSSTATLLRFQAPALLERMAAKTTEPLKGIQVRNLIAATFEQEARQVAGSPGAAASRHLFASAAERDGDEIGAALRRLGQTLNRRALQPS